MNSVTQNINYERSNIEGYYYSQFQRGTLNFTIDFVYQGGGEFCEYHWLSYPVDDGLTITSKETIILDTNTVLPGNALNDFFKIEKFEKDFLLQYLITFKDGITPPSEGKYTFVAKLELNDGVVLADSCIVKFNR